MFPVMNELLMQVIEKQVSRIIRAQEESASALREIADSQKQIVQLMAKQGAKK